MDSIPATPGSSSPGPSYTVLRIKRKATEPPLSSLVIHDSPHSQPGGRAKKRIAGLRSDKSRGFFRLAETVPESWEGRGQEGETLKERIKGLLSRRPASATSGSSAPSISAAAPPGSSDDRPVPIPVPLSASPDPPPTLRSPPQANSTISPSDPVPPQPTSKDTPPGSPSLPRRTSSIAPNGSLQTQYRVVPPPSALLARTGLPPRLGTYADLETKKLNLVFVDAQAVDSSAQPSPRRGVGDDAVEGASKEEEEEIASFLPMLQEYLKCADHRAPPPPEKEEWVYDLYYRDTRDLGELSLGAGDGVGPLAVGALLGYETYSPPSTPSSSEPEDEADEDSNEEDFYRNDYPEDEDADEDMREYEAQLSDRESDEEWDNEQGQGTNDGGGGIWDYR